MPVVTSPTLTVAVVIPAYNAVRFIGRALASVRAQTYAVDEIVIVDDGSTDGTAQMLATEPGRITILSQANAGPSAARNLGVQHTQADLIAFLDADDEWLPTAVETQVAVFRSMPEVALTTADMSAIDEAGHITKPSWFAAQGIAGAVERWNGGQVPNAVAALVRKNFIGTSVVLVRRSAFVEAGGFRRDLRFGEDLELWARIASERPIVCLRDVLGLRRSHANNTTKSVEPLLRGLARTSEVIAAWGGRVLADQGLPANELVGRARTDLGYWLFSEGRHREARRELGAAIRGWPNARAVRYWLLSWLPSALAAKLRALRT